VFSCRVIVLRRSAPPVSRTLVASGRAHYDDRPVQIDGGQPDQLEPWVASGVEAVADLAAGQKAAPRHQVSTWMDVVRRNTGQLFECVAGGVAPSSQLAQCRSP
jgi:hypothetical protein